MTKHGRKQKVLYPFSGKIVLKINLYVCLYIFNLGIWNTIYRFLRIWYLNSNILDRNLVWKSYFDPTTMLHVFVTSIYIRCLPWRSHDSPPSTKDKLPFASDISSEWSIRNCCLVITFPTTRIHSRTGYNGNDYFAHSCCNVWSRKVSCVNKNYIFQQQNIPIYKVINNVFELMDKYIINKV